MVFCGLLGVAAIGFSIAIGQFHFAAFATFVGMLLPYQYMRTFEHCVDEVSDAERGLMLREGNDRRFVPFEDIETVTYERQKLWGSSKAMWPFIWLTLRADSAPSGWVAFVMRTSWKRLSAESQDEAGREMAGELQRRADAARGEPTGDKGE